MNISTRSYKKLTATWWLLKISYGIMAVAAGLDKVLTTEFFTNWIKYLNSTLGTLIPMNHILFMQLIGAGEIMLGLLILSRFTRLGALLASAWFAIIAGHLIIEHQFCDVVLRDLALVVGAYVLAQLTTIKTEITA